jgi:hypothetical protein
MKPEPIGEIALSAAYMGMGFADANAKINLEQKVDLKNGWGQLETVGYLTEWAIKLERLWNVLPVELTDSSSGVWPYEVPEPFGDWFAKQIAEGHLPERAEMDAKLLDIVADYFTQCVVAESRKANKVALLIMLHRELEKLK